MLRAGREPLAVAMERAGRRPRPTAPLLPPAHSAGARGSGQSNARSSRGLRPDPDDAPAPRLRHPGRPREPERPLGGLPAGKQGAVLLGFGLGGSKGQLRSGVQPRRGTAPQALVWGQDLGATSAGGWPEDEGEPTHSLDVTKIEPLVSSSKTGL